MRQRASTIYLGYDSNYRTEIALARTLWLQGHPDQAANRARRALGEAERLGRPESLAIIFAWAASIFLWRGDLDSAEELIASCIFHAEAQSLSPLVALGKARRSEVAIRRGDAAGAVESLKASLEKVYATIQGMLTTELTISLVQGLTALGRQAEGMAVIDRAIRTTEARGDTVYLAELLRVKARLLPADEAEACLRRSLDVTRRQGGRSWELRTATDLASRWNALGKSDEAQALLRPVLDQFNEGRETADVRAAAQLLAQIT
jgi:tetratricopeptide (TPR) repeat protein